VILVFRSRRFGDYANEKSFSQVIITADLESSDAIVDAAFGA
jgi:hypothetical protein